MLDSRRMRLLAVETSSLAGGVALLDDERLVAEYVLDVSITHSERLMGAIDHVLADARWTPRQLEGLAVAVGPGSFTGLRIAVSTVKGLALALGLPIAAVPTLDAMAFAVPWATLPVCPVLHARKGEVYACRYRWVDGAMRREWEYLALSLERFDERLTEPTLVIGDGAAVVRSPACVGALGIERLGAGDGVTAAALTPLYLRPSEAELKRRVLADA